MKTIRVYAKVNGRIYQSFVDRIIDNEELEQIASCKRKIRKMLDEDGLTNIYPDYIIENK